MAGMREGILSKNGAGELAGVQPSGCVSGSDGKQPEGCTPENPAPPCFRPRPGPARAAMILTVGLLGTATLGFTMAGGSGDSPVSSSDTPAVLLIHTGEQRGHLEPCGCTQPQIGGLPRRAAYLASLPADSPRVVVDNGDMVDDPGRQSQLKAEALASFYRTAGYAAVNLGER